MSNANDMILDDDVMVCSDCIPVIANGDLSHLSYYYSNEDDSGYITLDERIKQIEDGMERYANAPEPGYIIAGDSDKINGFSHRPCECCNSKDAGERHHCIVLRFN